MTSAHNPSVSVILPTYNEAENIIPLIEAIHAAITEPHEIIVVDDDSPDGTWRLVEEHAKTHPYTRIERRTKNRGLTRSIQHGIDTARGGIIIWMDCDFSMPPAIIPQLLEENANGADIAVGSRFVPGGKQKVYSDDASDSRSAIFLSTVGCLVMRGLLHPGIRDYTSGFISAKRGVFDTIRLRGDYGEYCIDLLFRAKLLGCNVKEIPYANANRMAGESKTAPNMRLLLQRIRQYGTMILRLQYTRLKHLFGSTISNAH